MCLHSENTVRLSYDYRDSQARRDRVVSIEYRYGACVQSFTIDRSHKTVRCHSDSVWGWAACRFARWTNREANLGWVADRSVEYHICELWSAFDKLCYAAGARAA